MKHHLAFTFLVFSVSSVAFSPHNLSVKTRGVSENEGLAIAMNYPHPSEGEMFDIEQGPNHHLIDVDHDKLHSEEVRINAKAGEDAKLLTLAWVLFILPMFINSMFEVVYLI